MGWLLITTSIYKTMNITVVGSSTPVSMFNWETIVMNSKIENHIIKLHAEAPGEYTP